MKIKKLEKKIERAKEEIKEIEARDRAKMLQRRKEKLKEEEKKTASKNKLEEKKK